MKKKHSSDRLVPQSCDALRIYAPSARVTGAFTFIELLCALTIAATGVTILYQIMQRALCEHRETQILIQRWIRTRSGFMLLESMLACFLLGIFALGLFTCINQCIHTVFVSEKRVGDQLELVRCLSCIARDVARASHDPTKWNISECIWPITYCDASGNIVYEWVCYRAHHYDEKSVLVRISGIYDQVSGTWSIMHYTKIGQLAYFPMHNDCSVLRAVFDTEGNFLRSVEVCGVLQKTVNMMGMLVGLNAGEESLQVPLKFSVLSESFWCPYDA